MEAEAEGETLAKRSSFDQDEIDESCRNPDAKTLTEGAFQGRSRSMAGGSNGIGSEVSENGGVGEDGSSKEVFVEESEMNGASMLMKMQQSGGGGGLTGLDAINSDNGSGDERKGPGQEVNGRSSDAKEGNQDGETAVDAKEGDQQSRGSQGLGGLDSVLDAIDSDDMSRDEKDLGQEVNGCLSDANEGGQDGETVGFKQGDIDGDDADDIGDVSHEFSEGDFVWGKVKSHPWWPGRVYDPSNASDHANKVKQGDKALVAYFGDSSFAWCNPSQLKPLEEDFVEMSKQSRSRNFVNAVNGVLDEIAMLVDLKMICSCVPKENLMGIDRAFAVNDGIKEEVLVPEGGLEKFPAQLSEPSHCLSLLKGFAQISGVDNMLEFTVLKSFLSAFYRAKGGCELPTYHDPQPIPGLEDETGNLVVTPNYSSGEGENGTLGPAEDDTLSSPVGPKSQQNMRRLLQKCKEVPEDRLHQIRKQKSIAEIIGQTTDAKTEIRDDDVAKKQATSGKKTPKVERTKRKDGDEGGDPGGKDDVKDSAKGSLSGRKTRKVGGEDDGKEASRGNPTSVPRKSKRKGTDEGADAESILSSRLKKKKAAKLPESIEAADIAMSCVFKDYGKVQKSRSEKKRKETSDAENGGSAEKEGKNIGGSQEERAANELASERRERKKSKYLSFPYVMVNKEQKKEEMETESLKISSEVQPGKPMTKSESDLSVSVVGKLRGTPITKTAEEHGQDHGASASGPRKAKQGRKKIFDAHNVKAPAVEVLSRLRSAARDPLHADGDNSLDKVDGFLSDFRKSITLDGSKDKMYGQKQEGNRRISRKLSPTLPDMEQDLAESSSSNGKSRLTKTMKKKDAKFDVSKEEDTAVLLVSFNPASALPTKDELIKTYEKYGVLRLEDADMYDQKRCARIIFSKDSGAEEAFNDSQIVSPFPKAKVTFTLQYLSNERKTIELKEISRAKSSLASGTGDVPPASDEMSPLVYVKGKLAGIAAMLEKPDGEISANLKSKLQSEINNALEKVSAMVIGPSS